MKKILIVVAIFLAPITVQAVRYNDCSQCDYVNPPQTGSVAGGGIIFAGCRDSRATNYNQYFISDGSKISTAKKLVVIH